MNGLSRVALGALVLGGLAACDSGTEPEVYGLTLVMVDQASVVIPERVANGETWEISFDAFWEDDDMAEAFEIVEYGSDIVIHLAYRYTGEPFVGGPNQTLDERRSFTIPLERGVSETYVVTLVAANGVWQGSTYFVSD